ncbi:unnamed protein product [Effrenium voratum]|uniref:Kinesin motor domain-containing protein n=1 Tax=Effrenium voratum TaxID=2562239 RepID=A0AA36ITD6_9DINO|nr:unnamed protein product [Effrenium voratum]
MAPIESAGDGAFAEGASCVTLRMVPIREEECLSSKLLGHLAAGIPVKVLRAAETKPGEMRRALVEPATGPKGWITLSTTGQAMVGPETKKAGLSSLDQVKEGAQLETLRLLPVRAGEALSSQYIGQLQPRARITVLEIVSAHVPSSLRTNTLQRRARISCQAEQLEGWVSLSDSKGLMLVRMATTDQRRNSKAIPVPLDHSDTFSLKKKRDTAMGLLASARSGDFSKFQEIAEAQIQMQDSDDLSPTSPTSPASPARRRDNLDCCDARGRTPLMYASAFGNLSIVEYLLKKGEVYVNAMDDTQKTALHHAAKHCQAEIMQQLLGAGAMSEARDHNGCTALMFAAGTGDAEGLQVLLDKQANPNALDYQGNSALTYAQDFNHMKVVEKLIAAGAVDLEEDAQSAAVRNRKKRVRTETVKQAALESAKQAQVDQDLMARASERLKQLKERDDAFDHLLEKIDEIQRNGSRNPEGLQGLQEALQRARETGVAEKELQRGQDVLDQEMPRAKARQLLREAEEESDPSALRNAIAIATTANLPVQELAPFEELLRGAESKEAAEAALKKAKESRDVALLKFALQQAKEAGVDATAISDAEQVLKVEGPKHEARELLKTQLEKVQGSGDHGPSLEDLNVLEQAIEKGKEVQLEETEYARAKEVLAQEQQRAMCRAEVAKVLEKVQEVDKSSMEAVEMAKEELSNALIAAKAVDVPSAALRQADAFRRRLHNTLEDLRGSIRVFCRMRPLSQREKDLKNTDVSQLVDSMTVELQRPAVGSFPNEPDQFNFDAVFKPGTQAEVFDTCKDLVQSAIDGYNVAMFAYGQTGAGKTYTMYGGKGDGEGTAPRTIAELYRLLKQEEDRVQFTIMASMMELYRNELVDLLTQKGGPKRKSQTPGSATVEQKLNVRTDQNGAVQIEHLSEEECKTAQALSDLLERGNQMRTVCATKMNSESSRSHLILTIRVVGVNKQTGQKLSGKILLCDLAGSERLKKSDVSGEAQKEAIEINKSLTALGDVMEALVKGSAHVPYKNHKLTQVMSDALGGTSKTLMFVNCSPASSNFEETLMTLKFATRAKNITNDVKRKMIAKGKSMPKA